MSSDLTRFGFFEHPLLSWLYALAAALVGYAIVHATLRHAAGRLRRRGEAASTPQMVGLTLLDATRRWLVLLLALIVALEGLTLPARAGALLGHLGFGLVGLQLALWASSLITLWLRRASQPSESAVGNPVLVVMLSWAAKLAVWSILLMTFLANVGVNVTTVLASLGVGGVAVALAVQNILGDLFSSMAIALDKPFEVGHFIAFGDKQGTVERVGVKTTRIASLSGEQLVVSNSNLLKELVRNYSRMPHRRVVFGFRLPYGTSRSQVQAVVGRVREFVEQETHTRFDRGHLARFAEYGLEFEFVYYVLDPGYTLYMDIQQRLNLRIMELLESMDIDFAVPARVVRAAKGAPEPEPNASA